MKALKELTVLLTQEKIKQITLWANLNKNPTFGAQFSAVDDLLQLVEVEKGSLPFIKQDVTLLLGKLDDRKAFLTKTSDLTRGLKRSYDRAYADLTDAVKHIRLQFDKPIEIKKADCGKPLIAVSLYQKKCMGNNDSSKITCFSTDIEVFEDQLLHAVYFRELKNNFEQIKDDGYMLAKYGIKLDLTSVSEAIRRILRLDPIRIWTSKELRQEIDDKFNHVGPLAKNDKFRNAINSAISRASREYPSRIIMNDKMKRR